jgi:SpoIIAA-like
MSSDAIKSVQTRMAEMRLEAGDFLYVRMLLDGDLTLEIVKEHNAVAAQFTNNIPVRVLVDTRDISLMSVPNDVMKYQSASEYDRNQIGMAMLVSSRFSKNIISFYIRVFRPAVPTRLFTDEAQAREWLATLSPSIK